METPQTKNQDATSKTRTILQACSDHDVNALRKLAASRGGLLDDVTRRMAWALLLGSDKEHHKDGSDWTSLAKHRDEGQVQLDVDRSFVYYPTGEGDSNERKDSRKHELSELITAVLREHRMLHYFQGYHDIVQVLLLVLGIDAARAAVARLSLLRIRDFMLPTMSGTESHLQLLPGILNAADPVLCRHLSQTRPFFALAATLTLYAHEIQDYGQIARLFDFLLASEAVVPIYLFVAIVMARKDELMEIDANEPEILGSILTKLPQPLDLEGLIDTASRLFADHPPQALSIRAWGQISQYSVLKTTHRWSELEKQTLRDGERWFELQAEEIRRSDAWKKKKQNLQRLAKRYKRPARYTGAAILVAVLALAFRSSDVQHIIGGLNPLLRNGLGVARKILDIARALAP